MRGIAECGVRNAESREKIRKEELRRTGYCGMRIAESKRQPPSPRLRRDLGLVKTNSALWRLGQWRWRIDDEWV